MAEMNLRRIAVTALFAVSLLFSACSSRPAQVATGGTTADAPTGQNPVAAQPGQPSRWPMTLQDDEGRSVTVPAPPRRIISLAPSNTEILFAIGAGAQVVGVDTFSDYPAEATKIQKVGDLLNPNHELMIALQPDLILAIAGSQKMWEKAAAQGVPVVVVQPKDLNGVIASIEQIGRISGAAAAASVAAEMRTRLQAVQQAVASAKERPRVFYEVWHDPLMTAGPGSFVHDLIHLAGGSNVAGDTKNPWPEVSLESMLTANPEVILSGDAEWAGKLAAGALPAWQGTAAAKSRRVLAVDPSLVSRPGPRMIGGLETVARALHPELFPGR